MWRKLLNCDFKCFNADAPLSGHVRKMGSEWQISTISRRGWGEVLELEAIMTLSSLYKRGEKWHSSQSTLNLKHSFIRVKICAWHWLLLTLKTTSIKLQRRFDQTTSAFIGFLKSQLMTASQLCACYASKNITNDRCAWLREGFVNIWDVNVFVSCVAVSLQ